MIKIKMKKIDLSLKKNTGAHNANKSQKKISLYFSKTSHKDDVLKNRNGSEINEGLCKKRKHSDDSTSQESELKVLKYDGECSRKLQKRKDESMDEPDVIHNVFINDSISRGINKDAFISPQKSAAIGNCDCKENINTDKSERNGIDNVEDLKQLSKSPDKTKLTKDNSVSIIHDNVKQHNEFNKSHDESDFVLGTCITDDFNDCFEEEWAVDTQIDFTCSQRCKVINVRKEYNSMLLTVEHQNLASTATVMCFGFWKDAKVEKDNIVAIEARKETQYWVIDNNSGFLVVHPDVLISGTTVVGALFCRRKAVLAEKFRKIEGLPYYKGDQTAVVIGSLAHQLLQKAICQKVSEPSDITNIMDNILQSKETISTLYAAEIELDECRERMLTFVPKIFEFIQHYLKDEKQQEISSRKENFKGRITHVNDIEENIWLPKLGIKGKVDVTVEVKINSKRKIMPLEIKTGRPSFSLEHKGQIILYIMMMALTGKDTDTGLLLYLRENSMQEIKSGHPERRDLILLRNTLANYFAPKLVEKTSNLTSELDQQTLELPEPIHHHNACSKCSYNALCCMYLMKDPSMQLSESHPLMKISKQIMEKFKSTHIDYVVKWVSLLQIEETAQSSDNIVKYMWTLTPEKREAKRTCICNLKVIGKVIQRDSKYQHIFVRTNLKEEISSINIPHTEFVENEYVLVSTDTRINISAGFVVNIKKDSITVLLDRDITKYDIDELFHIDKYSSTALFSFNLANVGGLMGDDEICAKLRDIVIDRKSATFANGLSQSIVRKSVKILHGLNENQQRAVLKAMTANDYILIKGMPGTGKTQTLVALIELLNEVGLSVLITAHTNSAVDNILLRLLDKGIDFLRLGSSSLQLLLKHKTEAHATINCHTPQSLETVYSSKNIIGVTCYGAHHALLGRRTFDVCVVDESAQALQPAVLRPLYSARKFVLVGDPDQLPPIIKSNVARKFGADESLFARLDSTNNTVNLTKQYRMNKYIMHLANKLTYNDMLEAGNTLIENATFSAVQSKDLEKQEEWIQKALSQDINDSIIILNTGSTNDLKMCYEFSDKYSKSDQIHSNIWEAAVVAKLLQTLIQMDVKPQNIGIIAPYRAHVNLLRTIVHKDVEVNTVDQYQGRDKEIIFYSCAKSLVNNKDIKEDFEILGDHRRLTVAVTRAKHKLVVVTDKSTLSRYSPFQKLFSLVEKENIVNLNDYSDFSWKNIMDSL